MVANYSDAQQIGFAFVVLSLVLLAAGLIRRQTPVLRRLHIPASVVGGFLILLAGPQVMGELSGTTGLFPASSLAVWELLPGLLINVVFGAIMIGKQIPSLATLWTSSAPHVIAGSMLSFGQFAFGALAVLLILSPLFGIAPETGAILEMAFAGGHGTIAGMGNLLESEGAGDLIDLGLGLATVGMVTGIIGGSFIINWAQSSPGVPFSQDDVVTTVEMDAEVDELSGSDSAPANTSGLDSVTFGFSLIGAAIAVGIVLLETLRWGAGWFDSAVFDNFPLFPLTVIGGLVVQIVVTRLGQTHRIDRRAVDGTATFALDALIACAIGTMSLATLGNNVPALVILAVTAIAWSVLALRLLGPRMYPADWFQHAIADYGQSQGNVATGFILADMADPARRSTTVNDYGYKQLIYEPLLGGGIITALSVPFIVSFGVLPFAIGTLAATVLLAWFGMWRLRRQA